MGNSDFILKQHVESGLFLKAKSWVVYNGYRASGSSILPTPRPDRVRFGYLGRITPIKGIDLLLAAFNRLNEPDTQLLIAGEGNERYLHKLKKLVSSTKVQYLGYVKPEDLFNQINVLVVPSLWNEPLARVVYEAYGHGIPVITSDRGGLPEIVEEGRTGFVFDPEKPLALVSKMKKFIEDKSLPGRMRKDCLRKAQDFLPEKIVENYIEVFQAAVNKHLN
ncbi:hypothetical protein DESUT3_17430 [Desulfuromonas versatilis]|uniref:Glycosyl transferase family 1 domain-containing protein n=1 Tax=Desulfuromonas versatilis TaxID=2802975 RepID=A0ABM8HVC4_9BACT|nr:hypothetical protein DESUT3_17430 [Desulfuromonas versatilis]